MWSEGVCAFCGSLQVALDAPGASMCSSDLDRSQDEKSVLQLCAVKCWEFMLSHEQPFQAEAWKKIWTLGTVRVGCWNIWHVWVFVHVALASRCGMSNCHLTWRDNWSFHGLHLCICLLCWRFVLHCFQLSLKCVFRLQLTLFEF